MKKRSWLCALLAVGLIICMAAFSFSSYAAEEDPDPGVHLEKTATVQEDGTYILDLEAYATGKVTTTTVVKPCDLVLILDVSSSMGMTSSSYLMSDGSVRIQALVNAVNSFLATVAEKNAENAAAGSDLSTVAVVYFSNEANTGTLYGFTEITSDNLVENSVYATYNNTTYTTTGYGTSGKGLNLVNMTWTDAGLSQADTLLSNLLNSNGYNAADRNRVAVLFTDGYPNHDGNSPSSFQQRYANNVVNNARTIKTSRSASLYTIAVLGSEAKPELNPQTATATQYGSENARRLNQMLHAASSNFPQAQSPTNNNNFSVSNWGSGNYQSGFYKSASTASELENIFTDIAQNSASTETPLTSESVMKDIVSSSFTLPDGASPETIQVNVVPWDSTIHTWSATTKYSINDWKTQCMNYGAEAPENIEVIIREDGKTVDITGFDYGAHFLATNDPTQDINDVNKDSAKIVVSFPILAKPSAVTGASEVTNGEDSGIYLDGNAKEPLARFPVPSVVFTPVTYVVDYVNSDTSVDTKASSIVLDYQGVLKNVDMLDDPSDDVLKGEKASDFEYTIYKGKYGTISYGDDAEDVQRRYVRYAPTTMNWDGYDRIFIKGQSKTDSSLDVWAMLAVIPANSVFYEDTYITTTKTVTYNDQEVSIEYTGINYDSNWTMHGTEGGNTTQHASDTMGWIDGLADDTTYGNGAAHFSNTPKAKASFTVTGTGIDIYSRTNGSTGTVSISAKSAAADNESGKKVTKIKVIDTKAAAGDYYEIPICTFTDLPYGKYDVTITVTAGAQAEGRMNFYIDGVRVYNPIKPLEKDGLVQEMYGEENLGAVFTEVRSLLGTDATAAALYIDEHTVTKIVEDVEAIEEAAQTLAAAQQAREDYVEQYVSPKQAVLNMKKVELETAQRNLARAQGDYDHAVTDGATEEELAELQAAVTAAENALTEAEAALQEAQVDVDAALEGKKPYDDAVNEAVDAYDEVNDGVVVRYTTDEVEEYKKEGPKTEVLLSKGQQVAINVESGKTYYIGLRSLYGDNVSVLINGTETVELLHTADLYYEATPSDNVIVIKNTSEGNSILSVTKLRTSGTGNKKSGTKLASTEKTLAYVRSLANQPVSDYTGEILTEEEAENSVEAPAAEEPEKVMLGEDDISIENPEPTEIEPAIEEPVENNTVAANAAESAMGKLLSSFSKYLKRR